MWPFATESENDPELDSLWKEQQFLRITVAEGEYSGLRIQNGADALIKLLDGRGPGIVQSEEYQAVQLLIISPPQTNRVELYASPYDQSRFGNLRSTLRSLYPNEFSIQETTLSIAEQMGLKHPSRSDDGHEILDDHGFSMARIEPAGKVQYFWSTKYPTLNVEGSTQPSSNILPIFLREIASAPTGVVAQILIHRDGGLESSHNRAIKSLEENPNPTLEVGMAPADQQLGVGEQKESRLDSIKGKVAENLVGCTIRVFEFGEWANKNRSWKSGLLQFSNRWVSLKDNRLSGDDAYAELVHALELRPPEDTEMYRGLFERIPLETSRSCFVLDHQELAMLLAIDPENLPHSVHRGLNVRHKDRTELRLPPDSVLTHYTGAGMHLGHVTDEKGNLKSEITLPKALLNRHTLITGSTGSGKSIAGVKAILSGHEVTDGATIVFAPKGGDFVDTLLRARMKQAGNLDDVRLYDLSETLPGLSYFDIRRDLAAGRMRSTAVSSLVNQYTTIGADIMGDKYDDAPYAVRLIRLLIRALFDREYGNDAFTHQELVRSARRLSDGEIPPVDDPQLREQLTAATENQQRTIDNIVTGVTNRLSAVTEYPELRAMLNHVPEEVDEGFSFDTMLNNDTIIVLDFGDLSRDAQDAVTILLLSELWDALNRRESQGSGGVKQSLLHLEETPSITGSNLLDTFLSQGREFGIGVTVSTQFPKQFAAFDSGNLRSYLEVLNNVGTNLTANVNVDEKFVQRFADSRENTEEISNRLRNLSPSEWLLSLPARYGQDKPRPFEVKAGPLPPGHPGGSQPLTEQESVKFDQELDEIRLKPDDEMAIESASEADELSTSNATKPAQSHHHTDHIETTLTATTRLPDGVSRALEIPAITCDECGKRYALSMRGLREALTCHHSLEANDRDNFPVVETHLTLSAEERKQSDLSLTQLRFLQIVENVRRRRYSRLEYDIVNDSMLLLRDYAGIGLPAVEELIEEGLLRKNVDHPHLIYSTTPEGRKIIGESARRGRDFGRGEGDFGEQNHHVFMVEVAVRYLEEFYVEESTSDVESVESYYAKNGRIFDVVGLDENDEIRVVIEAERITGSLYSDAPDDYEKIAAIEPDEAIWVMPNRDDGHKILSVLAKKTAAEGVSGKYAETTPLDQRQFDAPGLTGAYTVSDLQAQLSQQ